MTLSELRPTGKAATALLWLLRVLTGGVFIISGWAKCVDLHGFSLKISEYLTAMSLNIPQEPVLMAATGLATLEFVTGVMLATGSLRRVSVWTAAAFMVVMVPLTVWIAIANPVSDCGCFGDFIVISNGATLAKNIIICAMIALLWAFNTRRKGLFPAPVQWLVIVISWVYPLTVGYMGYQTQPLLDFRPFKTGTLLFNTDDDSTGGERFIYSRNGLEQAFSLSEIPDSGWTYVRTEVPDAQDAESLVIYTAEGEEYTEELADELADTSRALLLLVSDPEEQFMTRAHYLQELCNYLKADDVAMYALVGASGESFDRWRKLTRPNFPAFEAEDTSLKMIARGTSAVVYLHEGRIMWKTTLGSLSPELPGSDTPASEMLDAIVPIDSGKPMLWLTGLWLAGMALLYGLGLSPKMLARLTRLTQRRRSLDNAPGDDGKRESSV